jgi:hypothetical protein
MKNCLECGSEKIVPDVMVLDRAEKYSSLDFRVAIDAKPDAFIFKERNYSNVKANVCADCGFIAFYATDPKLLWQIYQRKKNNVS